MDAKPKSIDIARKVVGDKVSDPSTGTKDPKAEATTEGQPAQVADKDLPFHNHPRWKEVTTENATLKQQNAELTARLPQLQDGAERFGMITDFMGKHSLEPGEVADLLKFGAEAKSDDPAVQKRCAETLISIGTTLLEGLGERLPADLQEKVNQGLIGEVEAKEMARLRGQSATAEARAHRTEEQRQADAKARSDREVFNAVVSWENRTKGADLKYDADMSKLVANEVTAQIAANGGKRPTTAKAAEKLMDDAYRAVKERLGRMNPAPKRQEVTPNRSVQSAAPAVALDRKGMKSIDVARATLAGMKISG
jgi:hypothetical protein